MDNIFNTTVFNTCRAGAEGIERAASRSCDRYHCLEINSDAAPFVEQGRSVFCKHVISCGKNVQISADTPVLFKNKVIAVGRAILSSEMICDFDRGVAIKIRDSLKSRNEEIIS